MAAPFDVPARLADGLPLVQDTQTLVWACHLRGYQQPDLTSQGAQVAEWYGTEDGLDLGALDADCAALSAAAATLDEALRLARDQAAALPQAWTGPGAATAANFIRQHSDSAAALVEVIGSAAKSIATLRDELWRVVDHKVAATAVIGDRAQGQWGSWLAAARAVSTGGSAAQDSGQVVDNQVKPFVDNQIGGQWVPEMKATVAAAADAYRLALGALTAGPVVRFDIPGDLGPTYDGPISRAPTAVAAPPAPTAVAAPPAPPAALESLASPAPSPAPSPLSAPVPAAEGFTPLAPAAAASPAPATSAGVPPGLGAAGEIPARLADALGGLLSPSTGPQLEPFSDLAEEGAVEDKPVEDPTVEGKPVEDQPDQDKPLEDKPREDQPDQDQPDQDKPAEDLAAANTTAEATDQAVEPDSDCPKNSAAEPQPPSAPPAPPPSKPIAADGAAPCEIAADELPQAGQ